MLGLILKGTAHYTSYMLVFSLFLLAFAVKPALAFEVEIEHDPAEAFQEIEFKASVKGGEAKSFLWEMGDGTKYTGESVTHVYKRGGRTYDVTLTVTDATGKTVTKKLTIEVQKAKGGCPTA